MKVALRFVFIRVASRLNSARSQLNDLSKVNVAAGADLLQQLLAGRVIQIKNRQRGAAGLISTQRHSGDVNVVFAEQCANTTDDSRAIGIFQNKNDAMRSRFNRAAVDADNSRRRAEKCATDRNGFSFRRGG